MKPLLFIWKKLGIKKLLPGTYQIIIFCHTFLVTLTLLPPIVPQLGESVLPRCPWTSLYWCKTFGRFMVFPNYTLTIYTLLDSPITFDLLSSRFSASFLFIPFEIFSLIEDFLKEYLHRIRHPTHISARTVCRIQIIQWSYAYLPTY